MYSTCLYCTKDLGANEILETLPIGRRVAFDPAEGRLWVVCGGCGKWNLVPFDTRLESIDQCEKMFADTRTRFSTENIGLARTSEGTDLVRIGAPQRPEFAAWRYGREFAGRRRKNMVIAAGGSMAHGVFNVVGASGGIWGLAIAGVWAAFGGSDPSDMWRRRSIALLLARPDGEQPLVVTRADLDDVRIGVYQTGWELAVTDRRVRPGLNVVEGADLPDLVVRGPEAITMLGKILPKLAGTAGSPAQVRDATDVLAETPDPNDIIERHFKLYHGAVGGAAASTRLALEMAAHETSEREALQGQLKLLEREWRKADELAKIADSLAVSDSVKQRVDGTR